MFSFLSFYILDVIFVDLAFIPIVTLTFITLASLLCFKHVINQCHHV